MLYYLVTRVTWDQTKQKLQYQHICLRQSPLTFFSNMTTTPGILTIIHLVICRHRCQCDTVLEQFFFFISGFIV